MCARAHACMYSNGTFSFWPCADMLAELSRREKAANIKPDPDIDVFMKVRIKLPSIVKYIQWNLSSHNVIIFPVASPKT